MKSWYDGFVIKTNKEMTNREIAALLRMVAAAFEVKDNDFFRVKAYQNAATSIEHSTSDLKDLWEENKLDEVPGIGPNLKQHLDELFRTGKVKHFETEMKGLPEGMFELLGVSGIGPKTAFKLAKRFKLGKGDKARGNLLKIAQKGLIREIEGFGEQSEGEIIKALQLKTPDERMLLPEAASLAEEVMNYLKQSPAVLQVEALGSLRRRAATVGDVDLAVNTKRPKEVMDHLKKMKGIRKILSSGETTTMFLHSSGRQIDVKTQSPDAWGSMLQHYTGSKFHNIHLRKYALEKGMSLSENGIKVINKTAKGHKQGLNTFKDEKSFYEFLGLNYIPPEIREDMGEIEAAAESKGLPSLVGETEIKGDLHIHTNIDIKTSHDVGASSVREILARARELNYEYIGLSDHNPVRALKSDEKLDLIKRRNEAIAKEITSYEKEVKSRVPNVIVGMEVDIRPSGELALEDEGLALLQYAIASIHSVFDQGKKEATKRVLEALAHPKVRILGHPTGRMLQRREGLDYDWDRVFDFCVKNDKWLEVNSSALRLDLPDILIKEAVKNGVKLVIDTDSHDAVHMDFMKYGVWNARRGWASGKNIMNTLPFGKFKKVLEG